MWGRTALHLLPGRQRERERERESQTHFGSSRECSSPEPPQREGLQTRASSELREPSHPRRGQGRRSTCLLLCRSGRRHRGGRSPTARSRSPFGRITNLYDLGVGESTRSEHPGGPGSVALCWEGNAITYLFVIVAGTPRL